MDLGPSTSSRFRTKRHSCCSALISSYQCRCLQSGSNFSGSGQSSPQFGNFTQRSSRTAPSRTWSRNWPVARQMRPFPECRSTAPPGPVLSGCKPGSWQQQPTATCACVPSTFCKIGWNSTAAPSFPSTCNLDWLSHSLLSVPTCDAFWHLVTPKSTREKYNSTRNLSW